MAGGLQPIPMLQVAVTSDNALVIYAASTSAVPIVTATSAKAPLPMLPVVTDSENRLLVRIV